MRDHIAFDPAKHPETHRRISRLGGIAAQAKRSPAERRRLAALGGAATKGISKNQGESHPRAIFTEDEVLAIRASGASSASIAAEKGCSRQGVDNIRNYRTWKHV